MLKLETMADLEALVHNQVQESLTLEYKASPAVDNAEKNKAEIAKDVSAMANADGGQIVYAVTEANHLPTGIDGGIDPSKFSGLWFEQVIQQNVRPQIEGLRITQVPLDNGNIAIVLSIPPGGARAPHQLGRDGRYYRRRNFRNDVMDDSEIRDMLLRRRNPELYVEINLSSERIDLTWDDTANRSDPIVLIMDIGNRSNEPAMYTNVQIFLDAELHIIERPAQTTFGRTAFPDGSPARVMMLQLAVPNHMPIFREMTFALARNTAIAVPEKYLHGDSRFQFGYQINTPGFSGSRFGEFIKRGLTMGRYWKKSAVSTF